MSTRLTSHPGRRGFPRSLRGMLFFVLLIALIPVLIAEVWERLHATEDRYQQAYNQHWELAHAVSLSFEAYTRNIVREEGALGLALLDIYPRSPATANALLRQSAQDYPSMLRFNWVDVHGRIIASSDPQAIGLNTADRPHFRMITSTRHWYISDLFQARVDGQAVFAISRGIFDARGRLQGMVVGLVDPQQLHEVLNIERTNAGIVSLNDRAGRLVYRNPQVRLTWDKRNGRLGDPNMHKALRGQEAAGIQSSKVDGIKRYFVSTPIRSIGWVATSGYQIDAIHTPIIRDALVSTGSLLLMILLGVACAMLFGGNIANQFLRLREHAVALGHGQLTRRIAPEGPKEFIDLAGALNGMADALVEQQQALSEKEQRQRALLAAIPDLVFRCNRQGTVLEAHGGQHTRYLLPAGGVLGCPLTAVLPLEAAAQALAQFAEVLASRTPAIFEYSQQVHGRRRYYDAYVAPWTEEEVLMVCREVTERAEADQAKNQFFAVLSHELLTPLTSILGWSNLATTHQDPVFIRNAIDIIARNARRQKRLVDDLLSMSQLIHHTLDLNIAHLDLRRQVAASLEELQPLARERAITLLHEPAAQPLPLLADQARVQQVVANLVTNALNFSDPGGRVTVRTYREERWAVLSVRDTGCGIPPDTLAEIFRPFRQVNRDERNGGLGLGLALAQGIVALHNGTVTAASDGPGTGSLFTVRLPLTPTSAGLPEHRPVDAMPGEC